MLEIGTIGILPIIWFILVAVLWIGYLVLEGFDYGVAMLLPFLGKNEKERRVIVNTLGPVWDGNEVWLLTAGGAMFAAFPAWYATLFSGLYLPLFLVLVGLIIRGVAFEYRSKRPDTRWRNVFDWLAAVGSFLVPLVFGVGFANFIIGLPVKPVAGNELLLALDPAPYFWQLFSPFGLLGGIVVVVLFLFHGSIYLTLKTRGEVQDRARKFATLIGLVAIVGGAAFLVWQNLAFAPQGIGSLGVIIGWVLLLVAAVGLVVAWVTVRGGRSGIAFIGTSVTTLAVAAGVFLKMFPGLGFIDSAASATPGGNAGVNIVNAASTDGTLTIMLVAALILVPIVLLYTGWAYWVNRRPLSVDNIPDDPAPVLAS
ncbi:MAG: cytochrome d ubiquinol oxidase subunit II [Propionibacteriaceae bacterium]|jgi:cytochrome d ubiquinol oxidase subunit II|nr:cytochrome d ubiquinol oxidase subunit II [Propionibacteriaceae bacterium]